MVEAREPNGPGPGDLSGQPSAPELDRETLIGLIKDCNQPGALFGVNVTLTDEHRTQLGLVTSEALSRIAPHTDTDDWQEFERIIREKEAEGTLLSFAAHDGTMVPTWCVNGGKDAVVGLQKQQTEHEETEVIVVPTAVYNTFHWLNAIKYVERWGGYGNETLRGKMASALGEPLQQVGYFLRHSAQEQSEPADKGPEPAPAPRATSIGLTLREGEDYKFFLGYTYDQGPVHDEDGNLTVEGQVVDLTRQKYDGGLRYHGDRHQAGRVAIQTEGGVYYIEQGLLIDANRCIQDRRITVGVPDDFGPIAIGEPWAVTSAKGTKITTPLVKSVSIATTTQVAIGLNGPDHTVWGRTPPEADSIFDWVDAMLGHDLQPTLARFSRKLFPKGKSTNSPA
jgi:hypothetical protein